ncbi:hypothetical protein D3C81_648020 [compost metagenome]
MSEKDSSPQTHVPRGTNGSELISTGNLPDSPLDRRVRCNAEGFGMNQPMAKWQTAISGGAPTLCITNTGQPMDPNTWIPKRSCANWVPKVLGTENSAARLASRH